MLVVLKACYNVYIHWQVEARLVLVQVLSQYQRLAIVDALCATFYLAKLVVFENNDVVLKTDI